MRHRCYALAWAVAAIPYLLLSSSQQAGIITHVSPDGSGERCVWARTAAGRYKEASRYLGQTLRASDIARVVREDDRQHALIWRDVHLADLTRIGDAEVTDLGIAQNPLSIFTTHTWKETLTFDRGDATDVEVHGQSLAQLQYAVRMPGAVLNSTPPGKVDGNVVEWSVKVGDAPQTFTIESRTTRWAYLVFWLYVLVFVVMKVVGYAPKVAKRIRRKPRKI